MNKSSITSFIALALFVAGYFLKNPIIYNMGIFAFSGAITNWLAIHMLFEKVPGLYGSGVIPARFEDFKTGIHDMMMDQFFTEQNIDNFLSDSKDSSIHIDVESLVKKLDLNIAFEKLVEVIMQSSFGSMLTMFGGQSAITPLREPFIANMQQAIVDMISKPDFYQALVKEIEQPDMLGHIKDKITIIIQNRLDELTPELVKQIIQQMIKKHLGWLVVWGGVFGGIIGLISGFVQL
ncbi:MAG: DUF445 domain-containing protein [Gammaproteobacteria bacterium]|nr:DUF445 domain-containing protein [Gammaproteobacteria bacterium]MDH5628690.1 DUF445 domain-containing protein [Gammaproteobacteria bacterium]